MGTINATLQGVADYLTANGVKTFPFEDTELPGKPPVATLYLARATPVKSDQPHGQWEQLDVTLRYYVSYRQRAKVAQEQMNDGLETILAALATDTQLDDAVIALTLPEGGVPIYVDHDDELLFAEWQLEVTPWA